jgi:hypothetical protein
MFPLFYFTGNLMNCDVSNYTTRRAGIKSGLVKRLKNLQTKRKKILNQYSLFPVDSV